MPTAAELKAAFGDFARKRGLKSTQQREAILDVFFRQAGHTTVEELLERVRRRSPRVGYATVYRTLKLLCEAGLADERHFGPGVARFERVRHHHDHLICTSCGAVVEFENDAIEDLQDQVARQHGYVITSHKHEIYGLCSKCRQREKG